MKKYFALFAGLLLIITSVSFTQTWDYTYRITYNSGNSHEIKAAVDSSHVLHTVWCDNSPGNYEIFYKNAEGGGSGGWSSTVRLTWNQNLSCMPSIIADNNGHIHIVYSDDKSSQFDLYHIKTTDEGASWSTITRLTWTTGQTYGPYLFMSPVNNWIRLVYYDFTFGNAECFFKRGTQ